jgi:hypothetical protein
MNVSGTSDDNLALINILNFSPNEIKLYVYGFILYEVIIFGLCFYLWIYVALFFIIKKWGNKIPAQILYMVLIYIFSVQIFNSNKVEFYSTFIVILLGLLNWWMFKKWIKFEK